MPLLPDTICRVDELVAGAHARGRVPTLIAGIVRDGDLVHVTEASSAGAPATMATDSTAPAGHSPQDRQFRIGSITKTMTAALVLALRDEGELTLDDLLYRHLPGTPVGGVTLRQMLGHAGGLQREPDGDWWERNAGVDVDQFLAELTPDKVAYPPLRGYHYSNLAYGLLGAVISRLGGADWASLVGKRLLEPLGMRRTTYQPVEPFARGYVVHPWHGTLREEPRLDAGAMAPAGQLWSTVTDLARWAGFLAEPDAAILAPASVAEMCAPVVLRDLDAWTGGHGLGLQLWRRGERVYVGHAGSMPGYLAILAVHRPSRTGVVAFADAYTLHYRSETGTDSGLSGLGIDLLDAVIDREPTRVEPWRPAAAPPPPELEPLTGRWWWMGQEHQLSVSGADPATPELVVTPVTTGRPPWRFRPDGPDRWRGHEGENDGEILRVLRADDGGVTALDIATFVFTRHP